jgi:hypothetical protein
MNFFGIFENIGFLKVLLVLSHFVQIITTPIFFFFSSRHNVRMMCNFGHSHHTKNNWVNKSSSPFAKEHAQIKT